ncbi:hypothetical protein D1007_02313 [Hordeum vulgare]|nr:hypothetical protein D1007_02313 [Hordeum vulgare]
MWAFRGHFEGYGKFLHGYLSGAEFALVRIDQSLLDNEELVREVSDCKTIGEAFSSGYLIAWPSAFIREKDN